MKAEIITIGDELLIGQTIDTNSAWIGAEMSKIGFDIHRITSVHDKRDEILKVLNEVSGRSDVVLITGGLGPTSDDITKPVLCEFFDTRLVFNEEVYKMIEEMMNRRGHPVNDNNRRQAEVPESCRVLKNRAGTAPGMWFEKDRVIFISMPGVPFEMKFIMGEHVIPELKKRFTSQVIIHKNIMTFGTYEAKLAEMLTEFEARLPAEIRLAYLPSYGVIKLRLTATGKDKESLTELVDKQVEKLYSIIPDLIYSIDETPIEAAIGDLLKERKNNLCTAESCTGGNIARMITGIPGSSEYFAGSVIAYDNKVKTKILGVNEESINKFGAVSKQVVVEMAEGARRIFDTDYSVATSGIAGPDGGSDEKPVGTVWIAVATKHNTITVKEVFGNDRLTNIQRFSLAALNALRLQIIS
jgi:nicotinamide-nucleotide amidase